MKFRFILIEKREGYSWYEETLRAKILGGWLVKNQRFQHNNQGIAMSESMIFISDPDHGWEIEQ